MRVLICGDRNWGDPLPIDFLVAGLPKGSVVIEGAARGADSLGHAAARRAGLEIWSYPARWDQYGKGAGPKRNQQMLDDGKPDVCSPFTATSRTARGRPTWSAAPGRRASPSGSSAERRNPRSFPRTKEETA